MMDYGNKKLKIMKKIMKILLKKLRSIPLPIVRDQDLIKAPKPFCRELMPHERKSVVQKKPQKGYKKPQKGYKKPFMKRIYHKWVLKKN